MLLCELGRDTRQHLNDTILSFLDDSRGFHDPVTVGIRINCLPKGELGCIYLCVMEDKNGKLNTVKRFRFKLNNWCSKITLTERYLNLAMLRASLDIDMTVAEQLADMLTEVQANRPTTLALTPKQVSYFTAPLVGRLKSRRWKHAFSRLFRNP